ncbi:MMPL family transporter [Streptomyces sp. AJS327]|uniref:MMPL family transporter n=1 Tax=Streptomyces sp. AJS327 TaxID=2545265 RepID=UPI0027E5171E|nr:MMPL family transporter [Streptomyces sp. AJS327]
MIGLWVVILLLALPFSGRLSGATSDDSINYLPSGADSTRAEELLKELPGGGTVDLLLVHHREGGLTAADRAAAREQVADVAGEYRLSGGGPRTVPSEDGETLMTPMALAGLPEKDAQTEAVHEVRDRLSGAPEGLTVRVGGPGALATDMDEVFESVDGTLMLGTASVVAVLLILTYRSPFLWLVPLTVVGFATVAAMAVVYGLVQLFDLTVTTMSTSLMTVLIFGAGTDYALLLVARYREELLRHRRPFTAMLSALRGCGPAVLASSGTVAAGLLCLLAADLNSSSGLGPVGAVGVVCALAAMISLLPAILVLLGRRVFWPLVPVWDPERTDAPRGGRRPLFDRVGRTVARRPLAILLTGTALLGSLAFGALNLPGDLRQEDTFTDTPESVSAMETVERSFPESSSQPLTVLARTDHVAEVTRAARATDGVASVQRGRDGGGWSELSVFARDKPESAGEKETIRALRTELSTIEGADPAVGGPSAQQLDLERTNADDRRTVIPLVLAAVLVILIALLRSVVAPVLLVVAVVASWGAAMGLGGLVFGPVLGFAGLDANIPLLSFVFLVALGVDYGIFLMHRMRENGLSGSPVPESTLDALRTTGGVITSAGVVLAATFCVLMTMPMVLMVEMGFVVAVGVLLDTFLVRTYLVTSAGVLLRRWIWWPGRLFRRDPGTSGGRPPGTPTPGHGKAVDERPVREPAATVGADSAG